MKTKLGMLPSASGAVVVPARRMGPAESPCPPIGRAVFERFWRRAASGPFVPEWVQAGRERA
jgi:hypothetical protein